MKYLRVVLTAIGSVVLAGALAGIFIPEAGHAMATLLVQVVNTPNVNVVNQPAVSVGSMPPVEVSSLPAVQLSGTSSVSVANGVTSPVPTLAAEALRSFIATADCTFSSYPVCQVHNFYKVPEGQIAVIESINGSCDLDSGTALSLAELSAVVTSPNVVYFNIFSAPSAPALAPFNGGAVVTFGQNIKTYANGTASGALMDFLWEANSNESSNSNCSVVVSGYLVPAQ